MPLLRLLRHHGILCPVAYSGFRTCWQRPVASCVWQACTARSPSGDWGKKEEKWSIDLILATTVLILQCSFWEHGCCKNNFYMPLNLIVLQFLFWLPKSVFILFSKWRNGFSSSNWVFVSHTESRNVLVELWEHLLTCCVTQVPYDYSG